MDGPIIVAIIGALAVIVAALISAIAAWHSGRKKGNDESSGDIIGRDKAGGDIVGGDKITLGEEGELKSSKVYNAEKFISFIVGTIVFSVIFGAMGFGVGSVIGGEMGGIVGVVIGLLIGLIGGITTAGNVKRTKGPF